LAATLEVGPGRRFACTEEALRGARPGDVVLVYPQPDNKPYAQPALMVRTARLTLRGVPGPKGERVTLDGTGFDYSGAGAVPRAIVQFNAGADGCVLEGFELRSARNDSYNGAGVRINAANDVTVRNCEIHLNDMGIMSNGSAAQRTARNQRLEFCLIHRNGSDKHPGYNHNLYLGGTSVTLHGCEVHSSTTGHNVKSRAHFNWIEYCYVHDSSNREFDLVDEQGNTTIPESHAVLLGNVIVKARNVQGNKTVIHFGQDGGHDHQGTLCLVHNTIVTPYISPVADLSAPGASAAFYNNLVWDGGSNQRGQVLVRAAAKAAAEKCRGRGNWLSAGFGAPPGDFPAAENYFGKGNETLPFVDAAKGDYRLRPLPGRIVNMGLPLEQTTLPQPPDRAAAGDDKAGPGPLKLMQYRPVCQTEPRRDDRKPDVGAYEAGSAEARK
jgi:hypothetical protein